MVYFCETCMQALQGTVRLRLEEMAGRRKPLPANFIIPLISSELQNVKSCTQI